MSLSRESYKAIGLFLKRRRQQAGLTQRDVSKAMGYTTPQFVSNWERGLIIPPVESMPTLAQMYKIPKKEMIDVLVDEYRKSISEIFKKGSKSS